MSRKFPYLFIRFIVILALMLIFVTMQMITKAEIKNICYDNYDLSERQSSRNYFDIPLSNELQDYTIDLCEEYGVPPELVFAIMSIESGFRIDVISKTNDYGLMQINKVNHKWLKEKHGIDNILDAEQNIFCGVVMISDLYHKYGDLHKALMAYNMGESGASKHWKKGTYSSKYSRKVVDKMNEYIEQSKCK